MKSLLPKNRPIRWTQGDIVIEMAYDRMGRRIVYHETRNGSNYINAKFVYDGYLCIQRLYGGSNGVYQSFVWDPTEQVVTRPLCMQVPSWGSTVFYMHDGNKNVSDVIYYAVVNGIAAHYDYAPFGAITRTARDTRMTTRDFIGENPFRFSSEYHDNTLGLVYYNYRHYNPLDGRWCGRDPVKEVDAINLYCAFKNTISYLDLLGMQSIGIDPTSILINSYLTDPNRQSFFSPSPSIFDHFGNNTSPLGEEKWFEMNYAGWLTEARRRFSAEINAGIDCSSTIFNGPSNRINIYPSSNRGGSTSKQTPGGNEQEYGDEGQSDWFADKVLGSFSIDYVTPVTIVYTNWGNGRRSYTWTTTMYVEDVLGAQEGDLIRYIPGVASITPSRRVRRASWILSGSGECCEK